ncbi:MAG: heat-shock protein Hsp20 [Flavobacteriales bacterium]|nr:heat-shock protein Hsp20 [Flavobacteriales bacterium]
MNLIKTQSYFPTIFDDFFKENWNINLTKDNFVSPSYNIKENDKEFVIELAIPGKENTDFSIEIQNKILLVSINDENKNSDYIYNRKEFGFYSVEKSFDLPKSIDNNKVTSHYRNGVLIIKLPKRKEYQSDTKQIIEVKK